MMRMLKKALCIAFLSVSCLSSGPLFAIDKPNILFLFTDDQRADCIAGLGNRDVQTPTLDGLVKRGFAFRNAYCFGSNSPAVCTPSRNMLLSGRAYFRWKGPLAPATEPNLPATFNAAGYETYHHGKRGNTATAIQALFEHNKYLANDELERKSGQPGKVIVDDAIRFLADRKNDRPFFMYLAFGNPHDPRIADASYMDAYRREHLSMPKNYLPLHPFNNGEQRVRDELLASFPRTEAETRKHLHDYYAVITALDGHLGRLLRTVHELGLDDKTVVVFSSDHGLAMGSHGLMGKQSLYDHSMKVPLVFTGPGIRRGESPALVYLMDVYPTLCKLAGLEPPARLDGKSLAGIIAGKETRVRDTVFLSYRQVQKAVRDEQFKLIRYPHIAKTQLFDLREDPAELHDLSRNPDQRERITTFMATMVKWQQQLGDTDPLTADVVQPERFVPPNTDELRQLREPKKKK